MHDARIYHWISLYNVSETVPLILADVRSKKIDISHTMLPIIKTIEGRDLILELLPKVDDVSKYHFIKWLDDFGDEKSIVAIEEYRDYPDTDIESLVKKILVSHLRPNQQPSD